MKFTVDLNMDQGFDSEEAEEKAGIEYIEDLLDSAGVSAKATRTTPGTQESALRGAFEAGADWWGRNAEYGTVPMHEELDTLKAEALRRYPSIPPSTAQALGVDSKVGKYYRCVVPTYAAFTWGAGKCVKVEWNAGARNGWFTLFYPGHGEALFTGEEITETPAPTGDAEQARGALRESIEQFRFVLGLTANPEATLTRREIVERLTIALALPPSTAKAPGEAEKQLLGALYMVKLLKAAAHALRSYEMGNSDPTTAKTVADQIDAAFATPTPTGDALELTS